MLRCAKVVMEGLFECRGWVSYAVALARDCRKIKIWGVAVTKRRLGHVQIWGANSTFGLVSI